MKKAAAHGSLEIKGEFNIFTAEELRLQLLEALATSTELEIDLAHVSEVDSAGLQLMLATKREAAGRNLAVHFTGHSPAVCDALELLKLSGQLGDPVLIHSPS